MSVRKSYSQNIQNSYHTYPKTKEEVNVCMSDVLEWANSNGHKVFYDKVTVKKFYDILSKHGVLKNENDTLLSFYFSIENIIQDKVYNYVIDDRPLTNIKGIPDEDYSSDKWYAWNSIKHYQFFNKFEGEFKMPFNISSYDDGKLCIHPGAYRSLVLPYLYKKCEDKNVIVYITTPNNHLDKIRKEFNFKEITPKSNFDDALPKSSTLIIKFELDGFSISEDHSLHAKDIGIVNYKIIKTSDALHINGERVFTLDHEKKKAYPINWSYPNT